MPDRIMVAHNDQTFLRPLVGALRAEGHDVVAFDNSLAAWDALAPDCTVDLLITRVRFPDGPHGVSLARRAHVNRKEIQVLFVASPEMEEHTDGLGVLLPTPTSLSKVVETANRILERRNATAGSSAIDSGAICSTGDADLRSD